MNKIKYLFTTVLISVLFASCNTDELAPANTPYVSFSESKRVVGMLAGEEMVVETKVYAVNTSGSDRTYKIAINEDNTVKNDARYTYQLPDEVTIPSGSNEGIIRMTVKNIDLDYGKKLPFTIYLKGDKNNFSKGELTFEFYSICESYDINALNGKTLTGLDDFTKQNTEKVTVKVLDGKMFLSGLGNGFLATNGKYNLSATENFDVPVDLNIETGKFTIAQSKTSVASGKYDTYIKGSGQYIPCANSISLSYTLYLDAGGITHIGAFIPKGEDKEYTLNVVVKM